MQWLKNPPLLCFLLFLRLKSKKRKNIYVCLLLHTHTFHWFLWNYGCRYDIHWTAILKDRRKHILVQCATFCSASNQNLLQKVWDIYFNHAEQRRHGIFLKPWVTWFLEGFFGGNFIFIQLLNKIEVLKFWSQRLPNSVKGNSIKNNIILRKNT